MLRAALALLVLIAATPLPGQGRGGPARVPGRSAPIPGVGVPSLVTRTDRFEGQPLEAGPIRLPSPHRTWMRLETPHFIVFSSAGEGVSRAIANDLEGLGALLIRSSPSFRLPRIRTRVFLFAKKRDVKPYLDAARGMAAEAAGVTVRHPDGSTILIDCSAPGGTTLTPRHELIHDLLRSRAQRLPLWLEEGVAEYYGSAGQPIPEHVSRLRRIRLPIPLPDLFALSHDALRAASWDFYAESWAAVTALLRRDPEAFHALLDDVGSGVPVADSLRARYEWDLRQLEQSMRNAGAPAVSLFPLGEALTLDSTPLRYEALVFELGDLLLRIPDRRSDAERHFRAARAYLESESEPRLDVAFALFYLHVRDGEREKADALFDRLVETPWERSTRQILLDIEFARAETLAREGQFLEAARILRELASKMPESTSAQLEARAAGLEALARE